MRGPFAAPAVIALAVACGAPPPAMVPVAEPVVRAEPAGEPVATGDDPGDPRAAQRATILHELEAVDRELDAIDDDLAASAIAGPPSRDEALVVVSARLAALQRTTPEALFEDTPGLLVRIASAYFAARDHDQLLAKEYGDRHPERVELRRLIEALRAAFDRQREVELVETQAWHDELARLPKPAGAAKVRQANRRALQVALARFATDAVVPSDAPADVRVAALRTAEAKRRIALAAPELGPKHPDMIAMQAELAAAGDALRAAVGAADAAVAKEIAVLDAPRGPSRADIPALSPARLARRAELAAHARELRREWDAAR